MSTEIVPPREAIIDLAFLLEKHIQEVGDINCSGDQVMDLHLLKRELKEQKEQLEHALNRIHLQGIYLVMTKPQKAALRESAVALIATCMHILGVTCLLDPEMEI
ncbi:MAG: hypothetical protein GX369_02200 [Euryarchaeota archaeon]|nr:hypothetical protein [Euryarchaeota archaeon]